MLTGGAWLKRAAVRRWVIVGAAGAVVVAAGASVAVALGGDRAPAPPRTPTAGAAAPAVHAAPMPAQCKTWTCTKAQSADLGGGYTITMWHAGRAGDFHTKPIVELARGGAAVQWWMWPEGYGWAGDLTCKANAPEPNCMLTDGDGAHSAAAQLVVLRGGKLVAPKGAAVVADLPTVVVRDLDGDGYLDVVALDSDYTPSFAQGHLFWNTFRFAGEQLTSTGCVRRAAPSDPAPTHTATGPCPNH